MIMISWRARERECEIELGWGYNKTERDNFSNINSKHSTRALLFNRDNWDGWRRWKKYWIRNFLSKDGAQACETQFNVEFFFIIKDAKKLNFCSKKLQIKQNKSRNSLF